MGLSEMWWLCVCVCGGIRVIMVVFGVIRVMVAVCGVIRVMVVVFVG